MTQLRQGRKLENLPPRMFPKFWQNGIEDPNIVRLFKPLNQENRGAVRLFEQILQFARLILSIYSNQYGPHFGTTQLEQYPFRDIRRPEGDRVPLLDSEPDQGFGHLIGCLPKLPISVAHGPIGINHGFLVGKPLAHFIQQCSDSLV